MCFLARKEPPGSEALYRQATQACSPFLGFYDELPGGDEFLPSDASLVNAILMFFCVLGYLGSVERVLILLIEQMVGNNYEIVR